jgi:hypothetical protein
MNIERTLFLLVFGVIAVAGVGCTATQSLYVPGSLEAPRDNHLTSSPALYSSYIPGRGWSFLVMPDEFLPNSPANYRNLYQVTELTAMFRSLKPGSSVVWRNDGLNTWDYPPDKIKKQVRDAAQAAGIDLQIIPCVS